MANFNKVILAGNLTHSPELRYLPSGVAVVNARMAVNEYYKDKEGNDQEDTLFIDVDFWDRNAEIASEYLHKGSNILVEGNLKLNTWVDKETAEQRSRIRVRCFKLQMLDKRSTTTETTDTAQPEKPEIPDDGVPF